MPYWPKCYVMILETSHFKFLLAKSKGSKGCFYSFLKPKPHGGKMKILNIIFPLLFTLLKNYFLLGKWLKLKPIVESLIQTSHEFAVNSADIRTPPHTMRGSFQFSESLWHCSRADTVFKQAGTKSQVWSQLIDNPRGNNTTFVKCYSASSLQAWI